MKKIYDWNISLSVRVSSQNQLLNILCSVHTTIHMLKIQICKGLDLSILDTEVQIFDANHKPLKATSTLLQNQITKNSTLRAKVKRHKSEKFETQNTHHKSVKLVQNGLSAICECRNKKCVNFGQQIKVNLGYGQFDLGQEISHLKCELCPYKSQHMQPTMKLNQLILDKCIYQMTSVFHVEESIFREQKSNWTKVVLSKNLSKILNTQDKQVGKLIKVKAI